MSTIFTPLPLDPEHTDPEHTDPEPVGQPSLQSDEVALGAHITRVDPLTTRPRRSSVILVAILGAVMLLAAALVWFVGARTVSGQTIDDMVWSYFGSMQPGWLAALTGVFGLTPFVPIVSGVFALGGVVVAVVRRRWWLLGQLVVFALACAAATLLKEVLERAVLVQSNAPSANSAPSGHAILATAGAIVLLLAVPRAFRALSAVIGMVFTTLTALELVADQWHRPSDVVMSVLLVSGLAMLLLAATRGSGMDAPGTRMSSASIQIVASVLITGGVIGSLYTAYLLWQIQPGIEFSAEWMQPAAVTSATVGVSSLNVLLFGVLLALRQLTASPLSKIGLVGAPPTPPAR